MWWSCDSGSIKTSDRVVAWVEYWSAMSRFQFRISRWYSLSLYQQILCGANAVHVSVFFFSRWAFQNREQFPHRITPNSIKTEQLYREREREERWSTSNQRARVTGQRCTSGGSRLLKIGRKTRGQLETRYGEVFCFSHQSLKESHNHLFFDSVIVWSRGCKSAQMLFRFCVDKIAKKT